MTTGAVSRRTLSALVTTATFLCSAALAQPAAPPDESLARNVPASAGVFLELRQAHDLLLPLVEPQVWLTLAELAGQPASPAETELWARRIRETVNMTPVEAIRTLFAQRVAFVGEGPRSTQDAVILCRPLGDRQQLLQRWRARPLPTAGRTSLYRLPNDVGLAVQNDLFVFGDATTRGLFDRILGHLEGDHSPSLADDPGYKKLLTRVPPNPDGVLFVRLAPPTSQPAVAATAPTTAPVVPVAAPPALATAPVALEHGL